MQEKYEEIDHEVTELYEIKKRIGKGAYGIVWEAADKKTKKSVAVKKIFDAFRNKTDAMRTYREVLFLKEFQFHPNIIKLIDLFKAGNDLDIYIVMERMDADLHSVIEENVLKNVHKRFIMYQLFCAVDCLSSFNVIHRDLKPSNVLLNANCHLRVADFGLARCTFGSGKEAREQPDDAPMTDYVATRWYRAPEILLADQTYTCGVDIWSLGCILGELLLGKPLFPGSSTVNQIEIIVESVQLPKLSDTEICSQYAKTILEKANSRPKRPIGSRFNGNDTEREAVDLLSKLLVFQTTQRLTAQQALSHAYVSRFDAQEKSSWPSNRRQLSTDEDGQLTVDSYRRKLYQIIETKCQDKQQQEISLKPNNVVTQQSHDDVTQSPSKQKPITSRENSGTIRVNGQLNKNIQSSPGKVKTDLSDVSKTKKDYACSWFPAAGLPSSHPRSTLSNAQLRYHCPINNSGPISNNSGPSASSSPTRHVTPNFSPQHTHKINTSSPISSVCGANSRVRCGRRQFGNLSNVSSLGSPKIQMQSYAQDHGTITASSFQQLQLGL